MSSLKFLDYDLNFSLKYANIPIRRTLPDGNSSSHQTSQLTSLLAYPHPSTTDLPSTSPSAAQSAALILFLSSGELQHGRRYDSCGRGSATPALGQACAEQAWLHQSTFGGDLGATAPRFGAAAAKLRRPPSSDWSLIR